VCWRLGFSADQLTTQPRGRRASIDETSETGVNEVFFTNFIIQ
jgi:flagellar basal body-associated protein FliL